VVAEHGAQRNDARAARDEEQRAAERRAPDEVAADRAAQFEIVSRLQGLGQVGRHLARVEPFDGQDQVIVFGRGSDRVAALCLVAVLRGEPHVHVLAGEVAGPVGRVEDDALGARVLGGELDHAGRLPGQSPA
jgi:hypothetical protein